MSKIFGWLLGNDDTKPKASEPVIPQVFSGSNSNNSNDDNNNNNNSNNKKKKPLESVTSEAARKTEDTGSAGKGPIKVDMYDPSVLERIAAAAKELKDLGMRSATAALLRLYVLQLHCSYGNTAGYVFIDSRYSHVIDLTQRSITTVMQYVQIPMQWYVGCRTRQGAAAGGW
jgi:hypothetical protein